MSLGTKKYKSGNIEVRAIKVSERIYIKVAAWCLGEAVVKIDKEGDESNHRVRVHTPVGIRVAKVGEFVYRDIEGKYFVGKDEFLETFELVK